MKIYSTQLYGYVGKAFTHRRNWSWLMIVVYWKVADPSSRARTSTSTLKRSRSNMGVNYASTTLMLKIVIQKSVSKPNWKKDQITWRREYSKMTWRFTTWLINTKLHQRIILLIKQVIKSSLLTTLLKDGVKILNVDDQRKATSRDHPTHLTRHQESTSGCTKFITMKNQRLQATKTSSKT